ncbi:MAG: acyl-CoA dehydrogenase family protein [Polyangiales bacterium]
MSHDAFRSELRSWLSGVPQSLVGRPTLVSIDASGSEEPAEIRADRERYLALMAERGYTAPTWPSEYGGAGLSAEEARILQEELTQARLPIPLVGMGLWMIGPTLLVHGNEAQKREFLPKIVTGEHRWCQGFSEPGAGSDLASLRTSAKRSDDGEHYLINGSKIWTSGAQFANWMFLLVRTDESSKHNGITFLLLDMKTPGVEVKPIQLISGNSMFCEVFFSDVQADVRNVVGGENHGWTVAKTLLNFERSGMGSGESGAAARSAAVASGTRLIAVAKETIGERDGRIADGAVRDQITGVLLDELALSLTIRRSAETRKHTGAPGPEISLFKLYQSELGQRRDELMLALRGTQALGWEGAEFEPGDLSLTRMWLSAKATTIYGGSSEIQRNIIAKRILKLPT